MAKSRYHLTIEAIQESIRRITPTYNPDIRFDCAEDGGGLLSSPNDWLVQPQRRTRDFDIRATTPTRPGPGCNVLHECAIRIAYEASTDLGLLDIIINEDLRQILNATTFDTTYWGSVANSVWVQEDIGASVQSVQDNNGNPTLYVVSVPLILDIRRE
jgi:hypothetical protein